MSRVAIDTNLLLLLVVGETDRGWIKHHKRLGAYDIDAYELLVEIIRDISRVVVTPNILTEVSNLACQGIFEPGCTKVRQVLAAFARRIDEEYRKAELA